MRALLPIIILLSSLSCFAEDNALFAFVRLETSMGNIRVKLYKKDAPRTVENFLALVSGKKNYRDIKTGKKVVDTPFYQNMIFHKVHPELGIQSGCPWGNGKGWPGYTIKQEKNEQNFNEPGRIAMSIIDGDPNTVGSQFFITTKAMPDLNEKYTVFGEVTDGMVVVKKMASVRRDAMMKPLKPIKLERIIVESE